MNSKKGVEISINAIIIAVIALLVLVVLAIIFTGKFENKCQGIQGCDKDQCEFRAAVDEHNREGIGSLEFNKSRGKYGLILQEIHDKYVSCISLSNISFRIYIGEYKVRNGSLFQKIRIIYGNATELEDQIDLGYTGVNCFKKGDTINLLFTNFFNDIAHKNTNTRLLGNETECPDLPLMMILDKANASNGRDDFDSLEYLGPVLKD